MKKKNVLMMTLSLCLVAVIAVGGTLAYLTASDGALVNTFAFANNLKVTLDETWDAASDQKQDESATSTANGYEYTNVVAGQDLHKAPTLTVTTEVEAYVFVRVTESANVKVKEYEIGADKWSELTGIEGYKVLYKKVDAGDGEKAQPLGAIFNTVKVDDTASGTLNPITIEVAAIQAVGFEQPSDAYNAAVEGNVFQTAA